MVWFYNDDSMPYGRPKPNALVYIQFRDGSKTNKPERAGSLRWHILGSAGDIIMYQYAYSKDAPIPSCASTEDTLEESNTQVLLQEDNASTDTIGLVESILEDSDGWILWDGTGERPSDDTIVQVKLHNGFGVDDVPYEAIYYNWERECPISELDIVAYKVISEEGDGSIAVVSPKDGEIPVGRKFDQGKPRWSLIPWKPMREIVNVLTFGSLKYDDNNWMKVEPSRYKDALLRHITSWLEGESNDPESGYHHLAHAGCCLLFLLWFELK